MTVELRAPVAAPGGTRGGGRRLVIGIAAVLVVVLAVVGAGIAATTSLFGPVGFVRVYLDALARGDAAGALSLPGVEAQGDESLLVPEALGGLEVSSLRELDVTDGVHRIAVSWRGPVGAEETVLSVERIGTSALLFPRWGFAASPTAELALDAVNDARVRVNDAGLTLPEPVRLAVLVPGVYRLSHESRYLHSTTTALVAATPGERLAASVAALPNERLRIEVADAARRFLDSCAEQTVLYPTGCPFGRSVENRIVSLPDWSISEYPQLEIEPRGGGWRAVGEGVAHLTVRVQDVFDGSRHTLDEDVSFILRIEISLLPGDVLQLVPNDSLAVT